MAAGAPTSLTTTMDRPYPGTVTWGAIRRRAARKEVSAAGEAKTAESEEAAEADRGRRRRRSRPNPGPGRHGLEHLGQQLAQARLEAGGLQMETDDSAHPSPTLLRQ
jgi:hypothetical protein